LSGKLIATISVSQRENGQFCIRLEDARHIWQEMSLARYTSVGYRELVQLMTNLARDLEGQPTIPF
jgi:hypothetical protein